MRHMRSRRILAMLLALSMIFGLLTTTAFAGEVDQNTSNVGESAANGTSEGGSGEGQPSGASEDESSTETNKEDVLPEEETTPEEKKTTSSEEVDTQVGEGENPVTGTSNLVVVNGETGYDTLEAAMAEAKPVDGTITYTINGKAEVSATGWVQVAKAGLADLKTVEFVGATEDAEISITGGLAILADQGNDIDVSFKDLTLSKPNPAYGGDYGHSTNYFTCWLRNTNASQNTVTYTNCAFPNGACNNQYGKTVYNNCSFENATTGLYNLWVYGGNVELNDGKFTGTRGAKVYTEGNTSAKTPMTVEINGTSFEGLTEKAAIVVSKAATVSLSNVTTTGCTEGTFQKDIEGSGEKTTVTANGSGISGTFNVTANKGTEAAKSEFNISAGSFTGLSAAETETLKGYLAPNTEISADGTVSSGATPATGVATVGGETFDTLEKAFAALSNKAYTLTLNDESAWDATTPVYWAAGEQKGYEATLVKALTAAYKANAGDITIICRPGADVGTMTHGHVADNITIYGNKAYVSGGECDLEVDTYKFSRETGKQDNDKGDYLTDDITITAYELDNLGVWGQRNTGYTVNVNLTDCDTVQGITVQRVYISGTTGMNNITLTGCDFETKATSVYSNADGEINITDCSFTGAQVPVNFNHKTGGEQTLRVSNCEFNACGDAGEWKQFAAPVRFVNSGSGSQTASVNACTFADTVGSNGDILIGDGRTGQNSNDVNLTVTDTEANIQAQKPGYYKDDGTTDNVLKGEKALTTGETLTVSKMDDLIGGSTVTTNVAKVGDTEYATLEAAVEAVTETNNTITLLTDVIQNAQLSITKSLTLDLAGHKISNTKDIWSDKANSILSINEGASVTITGNGTIDAKENDCYTINVVNGELTIENGTFYGNVSVVQVEQGTLTVKDGTFDLRQKWEGSSKYLFNCIDDAFTAKEANVEIFGGTFVDFDPNVSPEQKDKNGNVPSFAAPGVGIEKKDDGTFSAVKDMTAQLLDADGNSVKAYASLADAIAAAEAGQTVRLLKDATENVTITENKNLTLDLNGHTINGGTGTAKATITNNGTLTITDSSTEKTGTIKRDDSGTVGETSYYVIRNIGTMTIEQANVTNNSGYRKTNPSGSMVGSSLICNGDDDLGGTLNISGGKFEQKNFIAIKNGALGKLNVTGGTISSDHSAIQNWFEATITGGEINGQLWTDAYKEGQSVGHTTIGGSAKYTGEIVMDSFDSVKPTLEINGGNLNVTNWRITTAAANAGAKPAVSGGTFTSAVPENYCADGYVPTKNEDGTYGVKVDDSVAEVGGVKYLSLQAAINAASEGQTVTLLKNATEDVTIDKNITLDLGGKTLTNTGKGNATITIAKDATATVKNGSVVGGTSYYNIQNNGTATFEGLTATAGNDGSSMIDNVGTLTITSGTYTGGLNVVKSEEGSKLTINGGKFTLDYATNGYTGVIFAYGDTTITGGEFIQSLTTTGRWNHPQVIVTGVVEGYTAITRVTGGTFTNKLSGEGIFRGVGKGTSDNFEVSGGTFNKSIPESFCADGFIPTKNADGTYGVKEGKYVATTGKNNFETLEKAVSLVAKNGKITLLADVDANIEIGSTKNFTLDLNGHTINGGTVKDKATITNYGTVTIIDSSAAKTGTIKRDDNGTVGETSYYVIRNIGTMTIEQANVTNNSGYRKTNPSGSMVGSSLICNGDDDLGGTLNISGGKFEQKNFIAIKNGALGKLNVTGGTISSDHSAIQNWFEATITGGEINGQLWTDAYIKDESVGHTTIGGNAKYTGEIVMDISGSVKPTLEISGGTLDVTNWRITTAASKAGAKPAVSGGTFTKAVSADYCAEGFEPKDNGDGTFGVKEISAAKIGNVEYETLAAAFAAAKDGETIVLLKNSSGNGIQVNTEKFVNQGLTVDFNGHTYTVGGVLVGSTGTGTNAFQLLAGGKVTFMNGSIVGVAEGTKPAEDTPNWHGAPAMMIQNYCDLTLQNMTISGGDETVYTMSNNHGNVVIKDTTINAGKAKGSSYSPYAFDVCGYSSYTGVSVSVENSTINGNIELSKSKGNTYDATLTLGSGTTVNGSISVGDNGDKVAVTKDNSVDVAAPDGYKWVDGETGQTLAKIVMVAEVNGTGYETLAEAFAAATDNSTIKLLTDITLEGTTGLKVKAENAMNIVFDLNGHSITGSALSATTPALYIVSACGRDMSGSVKIINSSTEKAAISAKLPLQIFGSSYADEVRVEIDENVTLEVLEGGTNAIKMVQSAAYLVATEHTKTFYKNGGFMTTVNDEERIHEELSSAQKFSKNVKLLNDFATSSYLKIWDSWGAVTLDLDGHTYKSTAKVNMFELQEGANITFKKGTLKGSGDCVIGMPYNNSTLTLDSVAVENTGNFGIATNGTTTNQTVTINNSTIKVPNGMGVYFPSTGKLTINGGSIEANTGVQICAGSLEITGNPTIKATATAAEAISSGSILDGATVSIVGGRSGYGAMGQVTIDSGSFTSASGIEAVQAYTVNSNNQKADWTDAEAKVNISGGSYSTPVRENLCAEGFVPVTKANADGLYEVTKDTSEAKIGDTKFATLADALKVATSGNTIVLLNDVTHATGFVLNDGILIDLNGHNLTTPFIFTSIEGGAGIIDSSNNANGGSGTLKLMFKKTTLNGISRTAKNSAGTADISGYFFPVFTGETTNEGTTWYNYKIYWGYVYSWPNSGTSTVDSIKFSFSVIFRNREAYQYFVNDPEQINVWFDVLLGNTEGGQQSNMSFKFTTDHIKTTWAQATINANGGVVRFNLTFKGLSEYAGATVYGTPYAQSNYTNASMNGSQLTATVQEQG